MTTTFKLFVSLTRQIHERLVNDGTLPWSNYCSGAPAVPCGRPPAGFLSRGSPRRISSASSSDLAPQQNCCPIDGNGLWTTEIRINFHGSRNHSPSQTVPMRGHPTPNRTFLVGNQSNSQLPTSVSYPYPRNYSRYCCKLSDPIVLVLDFCVPYLVALFYRCSHHLRPSLHTVSRLRRKLDVSHSGEGLRALAAFFTIASGIQYKPVILDIDTL